MANVLLVYATREGQTAKIVQRIAAVLAASGHTSELLDTDQSGRVLDETTIAGRFQAVIVGAPIHASGYPRSLVRFVRAHRALLERLPSAFFSVGLAVASQTTDGRAESMAVVEKFSERSGWRPARVELIAGALLYTKYNFFIRYVMRRIAARAGGATDTSRDYEYTDWAAVERFAQEIAALAAKGTTQSAAQVSSPPAH